ncbi:hypothetical protein [Actinopolyspora xinjiangensis]|uniref:hypothetical protein n=1 Tax=Actinopolyspora xinjiangensis TaxID=405564 RepID=UPI000B80E39D|nr:hypothetical protein [Actinopolyspora xinjiangensis]
MAIDRARRARRRQTRRVAHARRTDGSGQTVTGVDGLFEAGSKYRLERAEWVAVAKEDDRETGAGPLDLASGRVRMRPRSGAGSRNRKSE